jgi:TRAP-type C4-dicarboxylate transport system permease small subunit
MGGGDAVRLIYVVSWRLSQFLAFACCVALAFVTVAICYDVTLRNIGLQPPRWTIPVTEVMLLYLGVLGAPYLVRTKGHILVEALIENVPDRLHVVMARIVYLVCAGLCITLAWYGWRLTLDAWLTNDIDYRSIDLPRWLMYGALPLGLGLSALEFVRYLLGNDTLYRVAAQDKDGF